MQLRSIRTSHNLPLPLQRRRRKRRSCAGRRRRSAAAPRSSACRCGGCWRAGRRHAGQPALPALPTPLLAANGLATDHPSPVPSTPKHTHAHRCSGSAVWLPAAGKRGGCCALPGRWCCAPVYLASKRPTPCLAGPAPGLLTSLPGLPACTGLPTPGPRLPAARGSARSEPIV